MNQIKRKGRPAWIWIGRCGVLLWIIAGGLVLRRPLLEENRVALLLPVYGAFLCFLAVPWIRNYITGKRNWVMTAVFVLMLLLCSSATFQQWHDPLHVAELPLWVDLVLLTGLYVGLVRGFYAILLRAADVIRARRASALADSENVGTLSFWLPFGVTFVTLVLLLLYAYFPYASSPDTQYQWGMLHGTLRLNDIHTPAHTVLLSLLRGIVDHFSFVVVIQLLLVSFLYGLFGAYFTRRWRVPLRWVVLLCIVFALGAGASIYMYPWKDTPYTFCVGIVTYFLFRLRDPDAAPGLGQGVALGAALAFAGLFRYNGIPLAIGCAILFYVWAIRHQWIKFLISMTLAVVVSVMGVQWYAYRVMDMEHWENGFTVQVFASGIAAVVAGEGDIDTEEWYEVDELLGLDWIYEKYTPWDTRRLIWDAYEEDGEGLFLDPSYKVYNNQMVVKMGEHAGEIISMYVRLLPRNLGLMLKDVLYNTWIIWVFDGFFSHAFLTMLLVLAVLACWTKQAFRRRWVMFLPLLLNTVSILLVAITNEERYLLPTYTLFFPLLLYVLATADKQRGVDPGPQQESLQ